MLNSYVCSLIMTDMNSISLIAIFGAIISLITAIVALFTISRIKRKYDDYEKTAGNLISPQRDYVEKILYSNTTSLVNDPGFFADANHILFDSTKDKRLHISKKLPDFSFYEDMGIDLPAVKVDEKLVACLMPFNKRFDNIKNAIADACKQTKYKFRRSDDELIADNTDIRKSIIKMILESKVVIAVLDGRNPNVFYEIGIAQSMGKLVLLVANLNREEYQQSGRKQPIDLLSNRLITYNNPKELKDNLVKTLNQIDYDN